MSQETDSFTYMDGDHGRGVRWITHDPDGHFAGEFESEAEAKAACERWNTHNGRLVRIEWTAPHEDVPASNRGVYTIVVPRATWSQTGPGGWHSMEQAARIAQRLRDQIAERGVAAVVGTLKASAYA